MKRELFSARLARRTRLRGLGAASSALASDNMGMPAHELSVEAAWSTHTDFSAYQRPGRAHWVEVVAQFQSRTHRLCCLVDTGADGSLFDCGTASAVNRRLPSVKTAIAVAVTYQPQPFSTSGDSSNGGDALFRKIGAYLAPDDAPPVTQDVPPRGGS